MLSIVANALLISATSFASPILKTLCLIPSSDVKSYKAVPAFVLLTIVLITSFALYARNIGPVCALQISTWLILSASLSALVFSCFMITLF